VLFDSQYINDFTAQLGAVEHPRERFRQDLKAALRLRVTF
jgi:Leu/Phe-tRNA-protein transferase